MTPFVHPDSQGIGAAAAKIFAREGARVVVTDIDASTIFLSFSLSSFQAILFFFLSFSSEKALAIAEEIKADGGQAIAVPGDVTDPEYPKKLVQETIK